MLAFAVERLLPYRRPIIVAAHAVLVASAYLLAFLFRFDFDLEPSQWRYFLHTLPVLLLVRLVVFARFHLYAGLWRYVGMRDILEMLKAGTLSSFMFLVAVLVVFGHGFPRSVFFLDWLLCLALVGGVRLAIRAFRESSHEYRKVAGKRALIVGAGDAGEMLLRETKRNPQLNYEVVALVDDDLRKRRTRIHGIEVAGNIDQIPLLCKLRKVREVLISVPSATPAQRQRIVERCRESGVSFKTVPTLDELLRGKARIAQLREVKAESLLNRDAVPPNLDGLKRELQGKRILVTGAGGSIGSELCRQLAGLEPAALVLFERAESSLYFRDLELRRNHPRLEVIPVVGDSLDRQKVEEVIQAYAPDVIYHAAAYKHVPLMEEHPLEAIQNNVFGTESVALLARRHKVKKLVFISTDKAVSPVGVMGMTKRVAESLLLSLQDGPTTFVAVRFGNVLGSDGSVLPLFQWQMANGGPVTVTDPEATRYFMLLSEAAQLVLEAGWMGKGGEVFYLDMGEPVRILDLAENLVRLAGLEPGKEMPIEVIGLRPGERLRETLVADGEKLIATEHDKILMVQGRSFSSGAFARDLEHLRCLAAQRNREKAVEHLKYMAATY